MKGTKEILNRIKAVKSTKKITKAMQLVAVAKMKKAQDKAKEGRPYALLLAEILGSLINQVKDFVHPLLEKRDTVNRGILVISTEKGLCGPLNTNLYKHIGQLEGNLKYIAVGKKVAQYLARTNRDLLADFNVQDNCSFRDVRPIVEFVTRAYTEGSIDTVEVLFPRFLNTLVQEATFEPLLPLTKLDEELEKLHKRLNIEESELPKDRREVQFEPNAQALLKELPELFVNYEIYQMILEAKASEHSARMVAMKSATDNADNLLQDLRLEYNKLRQAAITQEILEIAAATASSAA